MNDTFMKEKPVLPLILSMSLPMVLSMLVNSLYNIADSFFVAQISEEAMTDYSGPPAHPGRSSAQPDRASAHLIRSAVQPMLAAGQHTC